MMVNKDDAIKLVREALEAVEAARKSAKNRADCAWKMWEETGRDTWENEWMRHDESHHAYFEAEEKILDALTKIRELEVKEDE